MVVVTVLVIVAVVGASTDSDTVNFVGSPAHKVVPGSATIVKAWPGTIVKVAVEEYADVAQPPPCTSALYNVVTEAV